ncbi:hypothetical protein COCON_G00075250 [Conger conger]|uniref:Ig-like domain-containing protein n=1 Tax=Conger conger TaxID=82655 RepID=A0A9Q1DNL0_CONCO|nr:hypothetical protein COCON_G00075250 [Conger conger]
MLYNKYWSLWMFLCHGLIPVMGQCLKPCEPRKLNLTVALNSDVLLPCLVNVSLLQKAQSMLAAVWTHGQKNLLELNTSGQVKFWNHREHRVNIIKSPQKGNFSIFIKLVQESDQGLYCCELFDGQDRSMGCEEVQLSLQKAPPGDTWMGLVVNYWYYTAAGGAVFILLILGCACRVWHRCEDPFLPPVHTVAVFRCSKQGNGQEMSSISASRAEFQKRLKF